MDVKPTLSSDTMQEKQDHGWNNNSKFGLICQHFLKSQDKRMNICINEISVQKKQDFTLRQIAPQEVQTKRSH
jgi:hypothetical protein